jgi:Tol biopolymer transport system component
VFADSPVYTPDGFGLIHSSNRGGSTNLWVHPLNGGAMVRLTTGPGPDTDPTVTRTGQVAFANSRWRNTLELHATDGSGSRTLVSHSPFLWGPAFSPDSTEIAFSRSEVDGSWHIWSVAVSGGTPRRLTSTEGGEVYPGYAPDGQSLFFHTWKTPRRIGKVGRQGGRVELLSFGEGNDAFPDVSPDGRQLLFTRTERDAERLYIAPVASTSGGAARLLTTTPGAVGRWSPDGHRIAFSGNRTYTGGVFVVDPDDGRSRRLTESGGWPVWLPDGRRLVYLVARPDGNQELRSVSIDGTPVPPLVAIRFRGTNHPFAVSLDGKWVAAVNAVHVSDEVWLLDASAK